MLEADKALLDAVNSRFGTAFRLDQFGLTGANAGKFTVTTLAKNYTILLANSNTRNISLLRDRLGGG
jgi:hypothetical protein